MLISVLQKEVTFEEPSLEEIGAKYPVLKDEELIKKFMSVPLSGNQKGRIRQEMQGKLKRKTSSVHPDAIHNSILAILRSNADLTDAQLRKIRILYNMLKVAIVAEKNNTIKKPSEEKAVEKKKLKKNENKENVTEGNKVEKKEQVRKVKGKKRYVVFLGNLPLDVTKDMIMQHFVEMNEHIINIRIPKPKENKLENKKAMAYVELRNEPTYELALSKHHSMMGSNRIKVLYTTQKNSKISKSDAKRKSAKLIALQKSGMLIGSTPFHKKRSQRRSKLKQARLKQEMEYGL
ncbi:unnamed protein product [Diatraea saccharalis]|uniref:RRM domain-containing protein n=1 Tax=Diatraea saccharalis TaxID=40085 RepID=A0A9N9RD40_9NEOP|nr:unnamed protein product [Diatraea saccharalis]